MGLRTFQPSPLLKPYVTAIWDYEDLLGDDGVMLSILPDTATYLCFLYAELLTTTHKVRTYTTRSSVGCGEVRTASFAIDAHHCVQRILRAELIV
jgi:hypothetical protein